MYKGKQWVKFPFDQSTLDLISDYDFKLRDEFISLRADSTLKIEFSQVSVDRFWIRRLDDYPFLAHEAVKVLLAFPTAWECEAAFSQISIINTKHRNRLDVEPDIRFRLVPLPLVLDILLQPNINKFITTLKDDKEMLM